MSCWAPKGQFAAIAVDAERAGHRAAQLGPRLVHGGLLPLERDVGAHLGELDPQAFVDDVAAVERALLHIGAQSARMVSRPGCRGSWTASWMSR